MALRYLVVVSEADPVARAVAEHWGTPPALGQSVDGVPVRMLAPGVAMLRRPGLHIHDERLDERLGPLFSSPALPLVFPSIHESQSGERCLTVHPVGNPGPAAELGGEPRRLVPAAPRLMRDALLRLHERADEAALPVTYEATHHGPRLQSPAMFVEIGFGGLAAPPPEAVRVLADTIPLLEEADGRIAVGVGGGHYAPRFTDLALKRVWAFGHLLSRHALATADASLAEVARAATPGCEGFVFARAADAELEVGQPMRPRLSEQAAPRRTEPPGKSSG